MCLGYVALVGEHNLGWGNPYPSSLPWLASWCYLSNDRSAGSEGLWASVSLRANWDSSKHGAWISRTSIPGKRTRKKIIIYRMMPHKPRSESH